ncbi:MAG: 4-alpha-glucanotransferase [Clostridiales bacterium]|nr:4-alpha-glucanotransferase [Clostridiales bacterium]
MQSGILLPVFSLPSKYGIGTFGKEAYKFVDFLHKSKQKIWQMLPLGQTGYGDSPYQSPSAFAINPYFIDIETLCKNGLLTKSELDGAESNEERINYGRLFVERYALFEKAFKRFENSVPADFDKFCEDEKDWLDGYATFMAIKKSVGFAAYSAWEDELKNRVNPDEINEKYKSGAMFWKFLQYEAHLQYKALKAYANSRGVKIMGDMPIYVSADSADVWAGGDLFCLDESGKPTDVAGVPPDYFSENGQLWGNPLYNWEKMKSDGYSWWKKRLAKAFDMFDFVRIDHFRGFYNYYAIPYGEKTAKVGEWRMGPGIDLFDELKRHFGNTPIVAEDLGDLDPGVYVMLDQTGFPGMRVLEFAFDSDDNIHLPEHYKKNCIVYTGTHDNNTLRGWIDGASDDTLSRIKAKVPRGKRESVADSIINYAHSSVAETVIVPIQDYMGLGSEARQNTPSTESGNWQWHLPSDYAKSALRRKIAKITKKHGRA